MTATTKPADVAVATAPAGWTDFECCDVSWREAWTGTRPEYSPCPIGDEEGAPHEALRSDLAARLRAQQKREEHKLQRDCLAWERQKARVKAVFLDRGVDEETADSLTQRLWNVGLIAREDAFFNSGHAGWMQVMELTGEEGPLLVRSDDEGEGDF